MSWRQKIRPEGSARKTKTASKIAKDQDQADPHESGDVPNEKPVETNLDKELLANFPRTIVQYDELGRRKAQLSQEGIQFMQYPPNDWIQRAADLTLGAALRDSMVWGPGATLEYCLKLAEVWLVAKHEDPLFWYLVGDYYAEYVPGLIQSRSFFRQPRQFDDVPYHPCVLYYTRDEQHYEEADNLETFKDKAAEAARRYRKLVKSMAYYLYSEALDPRNYLYAQHVDRVLHPIIGECPDSLENNEPFSLQIVRVPDYKATYGKDLRKTFGIRWLGATLLWWQLYRLVWVNLVWPLRELWDGRLSGRSPMLNSRWAKYQRAVQTKYRQVNPDKKLKECYEVKIQFFNHYAVSLREECRAQLRCWGSLLRIDKNGDKHSQRMVMTVTPEERKLFEAKYPETPLVQSSTESTGAGFGYNEVDLAEKGVPFTAIGVDLDDFQAKAAEYPDVTPGLGQPRHAIAWEGPGNALHREKQLLGMPYGEGCQPFVVARELSPDGFKTVIDGGDGQYCTISTPFSMAPPPYEGFYQNRVDGNGKPVHWGLGGRMKQKGESYTFRPIDDPMKPSSQLCHCVSGESACTCGRTCSCQNEQRSIPGPVPAVGTHQCTCVDNCKCGDSGGGASGCQCRNTKNYQGNKACGSLVAGGCCKPIQGHLTEQVRKSSMDSSTSYLQVVDGEGDSTGSMRSTVWSVSDGRHSTRSMGGQCTSTRSHSSTFTPRVMAEKQRALAHCSPQSLRSSARISKATRPSGRQSPGPGARPVN